MSGSKSKGNVSQKTTKQQPGPSREARRLAAAILEVLAGMRSPTEAAQALSISGPRYYTLEQRALEGLVDVAAERARQGAQRVTARKWCSRRRWSHWTG